MKIHFVRTAEQALEIALGKFEKTVRQVSGGPRGEDRPPVVGPIH